ncbi:MAG: hypothetical protein COA96_08055 [SAR86 cluster bacterium]|uniref:DNA-directed RNA polymerase n=1 Tax=SAR86 cluster bacterium TaxID=2030880 RepID=A0A2A5B1X4_9GAMM|nr:MAG: hypothetical protein COA96_08055 [SAR86 cluster bacterium]
MLRPLLQKRGDIYHFRWTIPLDLRPIRHRFGSEAWKVFDFYESKILLKVVSHFTRKGIPCITIHDSVRIAAQHEDELVEVFTESIEDVLCIDGFQFGSRDKLVDVDQRGCDWSIEDIYKRLQESQFISKYT